jgi:hypothetical protein
VIQLSKKLEISRVFLVEHLEKSSPLIVKKVHCWRDLLWDDYLDYKYSENHRTDVRNLLGH